MRLLVTGDLHLGRRSAALPPGTDPARFSALLAWERIVEAALAHEVTALVLTGDVVDRENRFFEALGPLEAGIRRLSRAGTWTLAVAGNHDFDVLPRLVEPLAGQRFHLLGQGGRWERFLLAEGGQEALAVDGWSFPRERFASDPLAAYDLPTEAPAPLLGLLHAEVGAAASRYAPTSPARLRALPHRAWLLGHVHGPGPLAGSGPVLLYPGSPQPLDSRETGVRGPWLLEITAEARPRLSQLPLANLRYEEVPVPLDDLSETADLTPRLLSALRAALTAAVEAADGHLQLLVARLRLSGRSVLAPRLTAELAEVGSLVLRHEGATAAVAGWASEARPPVDLAGLARADDALGLLARLLQELPAGGGGELLRAAEGRLGRVAGANAYAALPPLELGPAQLRAALEAAGWQLLEQLLAQRGARPANGSEAPAP